MDIEKYILKFVNYFNLNKRILKRENGELYLTRYYVFRKFRWWMPSIYIHCIHSSDYDKELHSHEWSHSVSFILSGSYLEERREPHYWYEYKADNQVVSGYKINKKIYSPGSINYIKSSDYHRLELFGNKNVWTLFISGPKNPKIAKTWYFWNRYTDEYTQWEEFIKRKNHV